MHCTRLSILACIMAAAVAARCDAYNAQLRRPDFAAGSERRRKCLRPDSQSPAGCKQDMQAHHACWRVQRPGYAPHLRFRGLQQARCGKLQVCIAKPIVAVIMALRTIGSRLGGLLQPTRDRLATDLPRLVCCPEAASHCCPAQAAVDAQTTHITPDLCRPSSPGRSRRQHRPQSSPPTKRRVPSRVGARRGSWTF